MGFFVYRLKTLRTLFGMQVGMPGRPLLFMGGEFAQGREWNENRSIDWHECHEHDREKFLHYVSDLMRVYKTEPALHAGKCIYLFINGGFHEAPLRYQ